MSTLHPIVAVTGSSGAGTSSVKLAFERIFQREGITPAVRQAAVLHVATIALELLPRNQ